MHKNLIDRITTSINNANDPNEHTPLLSSTSHHSNPYISSTNDQSTRTSSMQTNSNDNIRQNNIISTNHYLRIFNCNLIILGIIFFGGVTIGTYLLYEQNRQWPENLAFYLVERTFWDHSIKFIVNDNISRGMKLNNTKLIKNIYVFHTGGRNCWNFQECQENLHEIMNKSIIEHQMDIPFNFLIGADGQTYEARGWSRSNGFSSLLLPQQNKSLAIALMGNFTNESPPINQIDEILSLIIESIRRNKLLPKYKIYGVKNSTKSLLDGTAFITLLKKFDNFIDVLDIF